MHSLHTRQSERQSCPVSHALCRDFDGIMPIRNVCRGRSFEHEKPKPGGQNFCHPIFYVLYNSRAGIFPYQSKCPRNEEESAQYSYKLNRPFGELNLIEKYTYSCIRSHRRSPTTSVEISDAIAVAIGGANRIELLGMESGNTHSSPLNQILFGNPSPRGTWMFGVVSLVKENTDCSFPDERFCAAIK